jgi:putative tryptophan/tyrosine transport system substrate-binding protein
VIIRRRFVVVFAASAFAASLALFAQQPAKVPRVGFLISETLSNEASRIDAMRGGLRDRGYIEGKNIAIEMRSADGKYDRLPALAAAELASLKVDVIVAFGTKALLAIKGVTTTIPVVDPVMGDPVANGLASSLARPGGNITGSVQFSPETGAKQLELLREIFPRITRVAVLVNPANAGTRVQLQTMRATADALKLELHVLEVRSAKEFGQTFSAIVQARIEAVLISTDTLFRANFIELADRVAKQRLPSTGSKEFAAAGGLMGYGPDPVELYRRAAYFVDKIIKGAQPGDLPIEQATKLDLVINLKTARALGITIPQALLVRANEVIQ